MRRRAAGPSPKSGNPGGPPLRGSTDPLMDQALSDVSVLDLTHRVAGPACTKFLADYGADVLKVEPPWGDPARNMAPFWHDRPALDTSGLFPCI